MSTSSDDGVRETVHNPPSSPSSSGGPRPQAESRRATECGEGMLSRVPVQLLDRGGTGIKAEKSGCQGAMEAEWRHKFNAEIPRCTCENAWKGRGVLQI